ncbi:MULTISPECIES: hypothetical protein [unclassified Iodidimonas]|jgi:flagellar biosynthesis/type III secretory pathway protein FliH|uniref:FliH/SctL family protein n=1 Tax=unclassified Iodidimonas TaxID=2626145 RepID=UPI00248257B2|nr:MULTISPECIES: hypothetical protein [unclassified Iodidimonas]
MHRPFAFHRDFDQEEAAPPKEPAVDPELILRHSDADLEAAQLKAREDGHQAGYAAGQKAASEAIAAKRDALILEALDHISDQMPDAREALDHILADIEQQATRTLLALLQKLAHRLTEDNALIVAQNLVRQALYQHGDAPSLMIEAGRLLADPLNRLVQQGDGTMKAQMNGLVVKQNDHLSDFGIAITWARGSVRHDPQETLDRIDKMIGTISDLRLKSDHEEGTF